MTGLQPVYLSDQEVRDRALPILQRHFGIFGFEDASVAEEKDFDGASILRMIARVQSSVPAKDIIDALDAIHTDLRNQGEDRYVYLTTKRPGPVEAGGADEDEG
jgi:hypothetical protein